MWGALEIDEAVPLFLYSHTPTGFYSIVQDIVLFGHWIEELTWEFTTVYPFFTVRKEFLSLFSCCANLQKPGRHKCTTKNSTEYCLGMQ